MRALRRTRGEYSVTVMVMRWTSPHETFSYRDRDLLVSTSAIAATEPGGLHLGSIRARRNSGRVLLVSSNPWDAIGAKAAGFEVTWIERVTPDAMALACEESTLVPPVMMFKTIRMQLDGLGPEPKSPNPQAIRADQMLPPVTKRARRHAKNFGSRRPARRRPGISRLGRAPDQR